MDNEWVPPQEAVERLLRQHYPGKKTGVPLRARMALIGALRAGVVDWRCRTWSEKYISDRGATYDENGGETTEEPRNGYPADFWQAGLAADDVFWANNCFIAYGSISLLNAPDRVGRWLGHNDEATAQWVRTADNISMSWADVKANLCRPGWQVWTAHAHVSKRTPIRSWRYHNALIYLIGEAVREPDTVREPARLNDSLRIAFEHYGDAPDTRQFERLIKAINAAVHGAGEGFAPIE